MSSPIEDIMREVRDPEFAKEYGEELAKINVAVTMAEARTEKGLTQEQLAERAGTSQPYIAKLESGYANPSIGAVAKILAVMGFRLVPSKDSLVPETKPSPQSVYAYGLASKSAAIGFTRTAGGAVIVSDLNRYPDEVLWQNQNLYMVCSPLATEACGWELANNESLILAGTIGEA